MSDFKWVPDKPCFDAGGLVIGMKKLHGGKELFYFIGDDTHLLGIGATRSGKSRTMVIQSICFLALAGESIIVSDIKGELNQYTGTFLKRLGYNVIVLDFKNPLKSDRYNLLQPIIDAVDEDNIPKATECVWDLVGILYSIASLLVLQHYIQLVNESDGRGGRLKNRVNFILDEFGNFDPIPSFDTLLTVGGGRGMRFNLFLQDFAQLESKYDEKVAKTIKGG